MYKRFIASPWENAFSKTNEANLVMTKKCRNYFYQSTSNSKFSGSPGFRMLSSRHWTMSNACRLGFSNCTATNGDR